MKAAGAPKAEARPRAHSGSPLATPPIALADLTITFLRRPRFAGDPKEGVALTMSGTQLAGVLGWLAEEEPEGDWDSFGDPRYLAVMLESLNEVLYGLGSSKEFEADEVFDTVRRHVRGIVAPLRGYREREGILKGATVSLTLAGRPAASGEGTTSRQAS